MKIGMAAALTASALASLAMTQTFAATCSAKSGTQTAALIELYTSEGCDSCPPADRWLSGIKGAESYAGRAVPLSMHVDYWDYIGWHDPYAQGLFAARQRELASLNRERTIYTPQVLVAGRDFHLPGVFGGAESFDDALARVNRMPPRADLGVTLPGAGKELKFEARARLRNPAESRDAALYVAVFENGLTSAVAAGENRGKTLKHDFVVREWAGPFAFGADGMLAISRSVPLQSTWKAPDLGVAMFVQNRSNGEVLQALQLAACDK